MNDTPLAVDTNRLYVKLIALWILSEAFLGGIIHGLKLPVSGLIVGGAASVCICLIGWFVPHRGAIFKATLAVAIFKMMLSPHSPPAAYIAVFFQGILGEFILRNRRMYAVLCVVFGILTLTESALQRILVLTVIYGTDFWKAVDQFVLKVTGSASGSHFSIYLAIGYILLHIFCGATIGWISWRLIRRSSSWKASGFIIRIPENLSLQLRGKTRQNAFFRSGLMVAWFFLVVLFIQSWLYPESAWLPTHKVVRIVMRSFLILLCWHLIFSPLLMQWFNSWLQKKKSASAAFIHELLTILPMVQFLIAQSWLISGRKRE